MKALIFFGLLFLSVSRVAGQVQELQQLKLDLEKLAQFKLILSQMKQGYQTLQNGYNSVRDAAKGNFELHKNYLDGLLVVNPAVKHSPALRQIASDQVALVKMFQTALQQYQSSGLFSLGELHSLSDKYSMSSQKVDDDLELVAQVISSGKLRMNDAERMELINAVHEDITKQHELIRSMISDYSRLMAMRQQQKRDNNAVKKLSGLK